MDLSFVKLSFVAVPSLLYACGSGAGGTAGAGGASGSALEARATKGGKVVASDWVQTAGAPASLALTADRSTFAADGRDLSYVEVDVVDAQGVLVPQASNAIQFTTDGPGTIVGVDNGESTSHESYKGQSRSAFSGKALVIIRATTTPGTVTLKAASGTLTGGSAVIVTKAP